MYGCDRPLDFIPGDGDKPHRLRLADEEVVTYTCPRKLTTSVQEYMRAHAWAGNNRLNYMYPPGELPAKMVQAFDVIDIENHKIFTKELEDRKT